MKSSESGKRLIRYHELVNYTYVDRKGVHHRWVRGRWVPKDEVVK